MIILNKKALSLFISLIMIFNFISCSKAEKKRSKCKLHRRAV